MLPRGRKLQLDKGLLACYIPKSKGCSLVTPWSNLWSLFLDISVHIDDGKIMIRSQFFRVLLFKLHFKISKQTLTITESEIV